MVTIAMQFDSEVEAAQAIVGGQSALARELETSRETVRLWVNGRLDMSPMYQGKIRRIIRPYLVGRWEPPFDQHTSAD